MTGHYHWAVDEFYHLNNSRIKELCERVQSAWVTACALAAGSENGPGPPAFYRARLGALPH